MIILLLSFIISCVMVAFMLPRVMVLSLRKRLFDRINSRKVHNVPASRLGGVTFLPAILFSSWLCIVLADLYIPNTWEGMDVGAKLILANLAFLMLYMIGIYDDIIGVSYRAKFFVQIAAAALVISAGVYFKTLHGFLGIDEIPSYIGIPVTVFFYVFVTNAINLIDGIDGLASLLSIMALVAYGLLLYADGHFVDSITAVATLGALVPFCYSNVFGIKRGIKSKIFMGDTGALVIGAILGYMCVKVWNISFSTAHNEPINPLFYILSYTMLLLPCFDVVRIIIHRYLNKKPLFMPDKNHIHHKFMTLGYTPRKSLMLIIGINCIFVLLNILFAYTINFTYIVLADVGIWTMMHIFISKKIKKHQSKA